MSVVLISGGGSGIGAAVARHLAEAGDRVVVCGRRREPLEQVALETNGLAVVGDVATVDGASNAVDRTLAAYGRIDGLVLNAAVLRAGTVSELSLDDWAESLRINLTGPFLLARAAMGSLRATRGAIVTIGSVGGMRASPGAIAYTTTKAGLAMLTQSMAVDHGPEGIRVNCVAPGWVRTEMSDAGLSEFGAPRGLDLDEAYTEVTTGVPARRPATAGEIAATVAWLLSSGASYVNGAVIPVDGGTAVMDVSMVKFIPGN